MSNHSISREPWWAPGTNGGFNQRCVSALTHPATVIALATLLLNDVLFKALWPQAWITGKLSDLAWVIFALPLLAFLLSLCTRGNRIAVRTAFITAYVGLPLLYAAFNTFEPVHYWILRALSIASGGSAGAPLDATDSMVIPLGWGIAVWVWQRPALSPHALRMRWGLLVAGVAVLASIATSPIPVELGITGVGVSDDGRLHASESYDYPNPSNSSAYRSADGGLTWAKGLAYQSSVTWGSHTAETPRGMYTIEGRDITLTDVDGRAEVVYSTRYLSKTGNVWMQKQSGFSKITTHPWSIVYDEGSGNVVVAMGLQGVLVGTPDGQWTPYAVELYTPTDFTLLGKTRLLLTNGSFLALTLGLALSITGAALVLSQRQSEDYYLVLGIVIISLLAASYALLTFPGSTPTASLIQLSGVFILLAYIVMALFGTISIAFSWRLLRYWPAVLLSLLGMALLVILAFMLWLHIGIPLGLAKLSALVLAGLVAFLLSGYIKRRTANLDHKF